MKNVFTEKMTVHFTIPHHHTQGGIYLIVESFKKVLNSVVVDFVGRDLKEITTSDFKIDVLNKSIFKAYPILSKPSEVEKILSQLSFIDPRPSLVIIHGLWRVHDTIGCKFAKDNKIPYILVLHGALDPYCFTYRAWQKKIWLFLVGNKVIHEAKAVICSTEREYEKAKKYLGSANVEVCHWGIEVPSLKNLVIWRDEIRQKLHIDPKERVLIFLGRMHRMKRPIETLLAFKKNQPQGWTILMVGPIENGGGAENITMICDQKSLRYYPPVSGIDKWKFLAAADAFVNLSYRENFGNSVAEAAAVGLSLLISDGVDIFPVLQKNKAADVVHINKLGDVERVLTKFLGKTREEHIQMGENAKSCFNDYFTQEIFAKRLTSLADKYRTRDF
jgi:glycosyltransferase involved in cell wall biosynthesis